MATKIEGWANGNPVYPGRHHSFTDLNSGIGVKATLVIGDERVFTESEVRAMLEDMRNDPLTDELQRSGVIEPIAAKHGIVLDPA